jgi:hypothetical protein
MVMNQLLKLISGPSDDEKSNTRRDLSAKLMRAQSLSPDMLQYAGATVDEETLALIKSMAQKTVSMLEEYATGASSAAAKWLKSTGDELIRQARELGELEKVAPPVEVFHRDGLIAVAEGTLQELLLQMDDSKDFKKLLKSMALKSADPIADTKRKFSELCEEYVLRLVRPEIEPVVSQNVDSLEIPAEVPVKKKEIAEFAMELCETYVRKHVNEQFIAAYNATEKKLIELCGVGNASDDPDDDAIVCVNPMNEALEEAVESVADDLTDEAKKSAAAQQGKKSRK